MGKVRMLRALAIAGLAALAITSSLPNSAVAEHEFVIKVVPCGCDGCVEVHGEHFTNSDKLKSKVLEFRRRNENPTYYVVVRDENRFERIGHGVLLLEQAGAIHTVGFITEPREISEDKGRSPKQR